jgi:glucose/arabinose dehydrogenase
MKKIILAIILIIIVFNSHKQDINAQTEFNTRIVAKNLKTPWEILWGPDNYIWMTERYGRVSRVIPETGEVMPLIIISSVFEDGERGLLGMALHPDFANNPFVYVVYDHGTTNESTKIRVERYKFTGTTLIEPFTLIDDIQGWWNHNGSRLWITNDLKIFITMGDAANSPNAQNMSILNGKILRLNLDGSIPDDNPFPNSPIWSLGNRNPQGFVIANGIIYSSEHGANTDDEINIILKGRNYGWPIIEGYCDKSSETEFCQTNNVVEPILSLTPTSTLAVAGLDYYPFNIISDFENSLLLATLKASRLVRLKLDETGTKIISQKEYFVNQYGRLRDICISPDGRVFFSTSNRDGRGSPASDDDKIIEIKSVNTGVNLNYEQEHIFYPNPVKNFLNISGIEGLNSTIRIYNSIGNIMLENQINSDHVNIDLRNINGYKTTNGMYFVVLSNIKQTFSKKIMITE